MREFDEAGLASGYRPSLLAEAKETLGTYALTSTLATDWSGMWVGMRVGRNYYGCVDRRLSA